MAAQSMTLVRLYLHEGGHQLQKVMTFLEKEAKVPGAIAIRGSQGFGFGATPHSASLLALSLDLPEVVEFYEDSSRVEAIVAQLRASVAVPYVLAIEAKTL